VIRFYNYLYYFFYRLFLHFGSRYTIAEESAMGVFSFVIFFNVLNILELIKLGNPTFIFEETKLNVIILLLLVFGVSIFWFLYKRRYEQILKTCEEHDSILKMVLVLAYLGASIYLFFYTAEQMRGGLNGFSLDQETVAL
jgi:hypothetical protein